MQNSMYHIATVRRLSQARALVKTRELWSSTKSSRNCLSSRTRRLLVPVDKCFSDDKAMIAQISSLRWKDQTIGLFLVLNQEMQASRHWWSRQRSKDRKKFETIIPVTTRTLIRQTKAWPVINVELLLEVILTAPTNLKVQCRAQTTRCLQRSMRYLRLPSCRDLKIGLAPLK